MIVEAALAAALTQQATIQQGNNMAPRPAQSQVPSAPAKREGGTPPVHRRRRRKTGMSIWKQFR